MSSCYRYVFLTAMTSKLLFIMLLLMTTAAFYVMATDATDIDDGDDGSGMFYS